MNIGEKIKSLREEANLTIEELAKIINDTPEAISKYEANEIEPSLDKKVAITSYFGISLSDISYNIDNTKKFSFQAYEEQNNEIEQVVEEVLEEVPFATSSIVYTEDVFNQLFGKDYKRYFIQNGIFILGYILFGLITLLSGGNIIGPICFGLAGISLLRAIFTYVKYRRNKTAWLNEHLNAKKIINYYQEYLTVATQNGEELENEIKLYYNNFIRFLELKTYVVGIYQAETPMLLIIDKECFSIGSFVEVKPSLENGKVFYTVSNKETTSQSNNSKPIKTVLLLLMILSIVSAVFVFLYANASNVLFEDQRISTKLIILGIGIVLTLPSIIVGIVSKRKFNITSRKNVIVGYIMLTVCCLFTLTVVTNHKTFKKNNDVKYIEQIENILNNELPNDYYTIYTDKKFDYKENSNSIYVERYSVISFANPNEVSEFEKAIDKNINAKEKEESKDPMIGLTEEAILSLASYGYVIINEPTHVLTYNYHDNTYNDEVMSIGEKYCSVYYYAHSNIMIIVDYTIN